MPARFAVDADLLADVAARMSACEAALEQLVAFRAPTFGAKVPIAVGAVVEIEDEDSGEGRTFFLAPVGAGAVLTGPGGDGVISVVTPASPVGRAVLGRRQGEVVDIVIEGRERSWVITWVA